MPHRQGQLATNRTREKSNGDRKISDYVPDGLCRKRGIVLAVAGAMADAAMIQTAQVQDLPPLAGPSGREPQAAWSALDGIDDLGVQYANVYGRINPARNHLRLMAAVLNDAIRVLSKHRSPRRRREEFEDDGEGQVELVHRVGSSLSATGGEAPVPCIARPGPQ